MIIKLFELQKNKEIKTTLNLLYGNNQGLKNQIINDYFISNFKGNILKYKEDDILNNHNEFISNLLNQSLFENEKILIISRTTDKILSVILEILERDIKETKIILESNILEKKSKLRVLFEKDKNLVCIPVYEDDNKSLEFIIQDFLKKKKIKFSQEIINILIDRAKGDRGNLKNELSKLESLSLSKKNINLEDVQKLTNLAENYTVFELSDNYLAKNSKKISRILNENNYNSDDCILILRTILNKSKRLLKLKNEIDENKNIDLVLSSFKPPIFWKEKEVVKKQLQLCSTEEIKKIIYKINDLELLVKKNSLNSFNFVSDFVRNY
jgi:DNA polymerase-3 subunit delta